MYVEDNIKDTKKLTSVEESINENTKSIVTTFSNFFFYYIMIFIIIKTKKIQNLEKTLSNDLRDIKTLLI